MLIIEDDDPQPSGTRIPKWIARFVGKGRMSTKTIVYDYPLLCFGMTELQNRDARGAREYAMVRDIPESIKHLVGDIEVNIPEEMIVVGDKVRRAKVKSIWVLNITILDESKTIVKRGKTIVRKQVSPFMEKYFTVKEKEEDTEEIIRF